MDTQIIIVNNTKEGYFFMVGHTQLKHFRERESVCVLTDLVGGVDWPLLCEGLVMALSYWHGSGRTWETNR